MIQINYTGRVFVCRGLKESDTENWNKHFKYNKTYLEAAIDGFGENNCDNNTLLLHISNGKTDCQVLYVDKNQFELVTTIMPVSLN